MKTKIGMCLIGLLLGCAITAGFAQSNQKLAQTGLKFLTVVSDARAAALGEAVTSLQTGSSSLFFNPAGMATMPGNADVSASINQWIADIRHYTFSVAISPYHGDYGVLGLSVQSVDYGEFYGTVVDQNREQGYDDTGIFKLHAFALGVGYAKQLTERFSVGVQGRWVRQNLGGSTIPFDVTGSATDSSQTIRARNVLNPVVFDFGTQFNTGIKSLVFGMSVRNFSPDIQYAQEAFQAPLAFTLGISMNMMDLMNELPFQQSLYMSVDASHYRDHPEQLKIGLDYRVFNIFSLRGGFASSNDESSFSWGLGVTQSGFTLDYAYTPFGVFDKVQRFTARFSL